MNPGRRVTPPLPSNFVTLRHLQEEHHKKKQQEEEEQRKKKQQEEEEQRKKKQQEEEEQRKKKQQEEEEQRKKKLQEEEEEERRRQQAAAEAAEAKRRASQQRQQEEQPQQRRKHKPCKQKPKPRPNTLEHNSTATSAGVPKDEPSAEQSSAPVIKNDHPRRPHVWLPLPKKGGSDACKAEPDSPGEAETLTLEAKRDPLPRCMPSGRRGGVTKEGDAAEAQIRKEKKEKKSGGRGRREVDAGKDVPISKGKAEAEFLTPESSKESLVATRHESRPVEFSTRRKALDSRRRYPGMRRSYDHGQGSGRAAREGMVWVKKTDGALGM